MPPFLIPDLETEPKTHKGTEYALSYKTSLTHFAFIDLNKKFVSWKEWPAQTGMPFHGGNA